MRRLRKAIGDDPTWLMPIIGLIGTISFAVCMLLMHDPRMPLWASIHDGTSASPFMDFFYHYGLSSNPGHLYETQAACFPPLAYLLYRLMYLMTTDGSVLPVGGGDTGYESFVGGLFPSLACLLYVSMALVLTYVALSHTGRHDVRKEMLLMPALVTSPAMAFAACLQANSVLYVMPMLAIAVSLRESESKWWREAALWLFASSIALKLYPVFFVLLYIHDRRYAEIARCAAYSSLLVFVPFVWFGGIGGMVGWVSNILTMGNMLPRIEFLFGALSMATGALLPAGAAALAARTLFVAILMASVVVAVTCDDPYVRLTIVACLMTTVPSGAYRYTLIYLMIPAIAYAKGLYGEPPRKPLVAMSVAHGLLLSTPAWLAVATGLTRSAPGGTPYMSLYLYAVAYSIYAMALGAGIRSRTERGAAMETAPGHA